MNIKEWALEDRPREKLYQQGAKQLTNVELLAIILSSGTRSLSAIDLAKNILSGVSNDLDQLANQEIGDLKKIKGIGPAKAVTIKAVMELANRKGKGSHVRQKITCSQDAYNILYPFFADLNVEEFWVICLNRANKVLSKKKLSIGGLTGTVVDPKVIFRYALTHSATAIILAHNHPSGNLFPSQVDIRLTEKIKAAAKNLDISVFDHLIFAGGSYYSFADEGQL